MGRHYSVMGKSSKTVKHCVVLAIYAKHSTKHVGSVLMKHLDFALC